MFTQDEIEQGTVTHAALGPHYFSARRIVEHSMSKLESGDMEGVVKKFVDDAYAKLQEVVEDCLWSDAETNLQGMMWRTVDEIVKGLLSGQKWVMDRYLLGERYDCEAVRATVADHISDELAKARIADLEAEIARLEKDLKWARGR